MRRHLHRHPELSFHETATSAYVEERLAAMGISYKKGYGAFGGEAGHGIVGIIEGGRPGRTIGLRADMDALPMEEDSGEDFARFLEDLLFFLIGAFPYLVLLGGAAFIIRRAAKKKVLSGERIGSAYGARL